MLKIKEINENKSFPSQDYRMRVYYPSNKINFAGNGNDLIKGLERSPKFIPAHYSYNDQGSFLFTQASANSAYYLNRKERSILQQYADEVVKTTGPCDIVDLGSGDCNKTRILLAAYSKLFPEFTFYPIDVSGEILTESARELIEEYQSLKIVGLIGDYEHGINWLKLNPKTKRLHVCLGSTLGNMTELEQRDLLSSLKSCMNNGDHVLFALDLAKSKEIIETTYNMEYASRFIINKLNHINKLFEGNFIIEQFQHQAVYDEKTGLTEARIYSLKNQKVSLKKLNYEFSLKKNEYMIGEIMYKFSISYINQILSEIGFEVQNIWTDSDDWYSVVTAQLN